MTEFSKTSERTRILGTFMESVDNCLSPLEAALYQNGVVLVALGGRGDRATALWQMVDSGSANPSIIDFGNGEGPDAFHAVAQFACNATPMDKAVFESLSRLAFEALAQEGRAFRAEQIRTFLGGALEALPEAIAVFDENERFVFWNDRFAEIYGKGVELREGRKFEDHLRACLAQGLVTNAIGCEDQWLSERLQRFRDAEGAHEHPLSSGQWVSTQDRPLPQGGRVGIRTDITDYIEREASFKLLFEANPSPMLIIDKNTLAIVAVNQASATFYGYSAEDMLRMTLPQIRPEKTGGEIQAMIDRLEAAEVTQQPRIHVCADGSQRIVRVNARIIQHRGRECIIAAIFDMTERFRAEDDLMRTRRFLRDVVDHVPVALFVKDVEDGGKYILYNRAGEQLFGQSQAEVIGSHDAVLLDPSVSEEYRIQDNRVLRQGMLDIIEERQLKPEEGGGVQSIRLRKVALNDSVTGQPRYVLGLAEDVTEQRTREAEIARLALHDQLTGLPNRRHFDEQLRTGLANLETDFMQAVFFIDLDGFKAVNDTHGHAAGDTLLQLVAERLLSILRPQDTVARLGGDEFAVTATLRNHHEAEQVASRIVSALSVPYQHESMHLRISTSVGISLSGSKICLPQNLVAEADVALYHAKRSGKNRFSLWNSNPPETGLSASDRAMPARIK